MHAVGRSLISQPQLLILRSYHDDQAEMCHDSHRASNLCVKGQNNLVDVLPTWQRKHGEPEHISLCLPYVFGLLA